MSKRIFAGTYLLQDKEKKHFGFIQGFSSAPDYDTKIKIFINNEKIDKTDIDGTKMFILDMFELKSLNEGCQYIENSLKVHISLSKSDLLKDEFYTHYNYEHNDE